VPTWDAVCEVAATLPETALDTGVENPAWRVRGKVFVRRNGRLRVPEEAALRAARGEFVAVYVDREEKELLTRQEPQTFFVTPHWQSGPFVLVWLDTVAPGLLRELVLDAWRARAPKRLARRLDGA
jgi:hypothetical protein